MSGGAARPRRHRRLVVLGRHQCRRIVAAPSRCAQRPATSRLPTERDTTPARRAVDDLATVWSGDDRSTWGTCAPPPPRCAQMCTGGGNPPPCPPPEIR